jgi:[ribosomal protein S5]-alanine N-acetyltransferase
MHYHYPMREPLLTDRLILRDISEADGQLLFELDSDPEVMRYIGRWRAPDDSWYRDRIHTVHLPQQAHPWHGVRIVLDRTTGEFLGWVFIRPATDSMDARELGWTQPSEQEIGYRLRQSAWGRGIATEAATLLVRIALADPSTTAVVACAQAGNAGSLRVLEKLGLVRVGDVMLPVATEPIVKLARIK